MDVVVLLIVVVVLDTVVLVEVTEVVVEVNCSLAGHHMVRFRVNVRGRSREHSSAARWYVSAHTVHAHGIKTRVPACAFVHAYDQHMGLGYGWPVCALY
jgi:hypothetical protein